MNPDKMNQCTVDLGWRLGERLRGGGGARERWRCKNQRARRKGAGAVFGARKHEGVRGAGAAVSDAGDGYDDATICNA